MPLVAWRGLWKDSGFAPTIFNQARRFFALAIASRVETDRSAHIRACIVFALMAFEAYFFELIRGFIQANRQRLDVQNLQRLEDGIAERTGITRAVSEWPELLTGTSLDKGRRTYSDLMNAIQYRNALVHGKITEPIPSLGKLAQDLETCGYAQAVIVIVSEMISVVAAHFGFKIPDWVRETQPANPALQPTALRTLRVLQRALARSARLPAAECHIR